MVRVWEVATGRAVQAFQVCTNSGVFGGRAKPGVGSGVIVFAGSLSSALLKSRGKVTAGCSGN